MFHPKLIFGNFLFKRFKGTVIVRMAAHKPIKSNKMSTSSQGFLLSYRWQWCGPSPQLTYLTTPTTPLALLSLLLASRAWLATFWSYMHFAGGPCAYLTFDLQSPFTLPSPVRMCDYVWDEQLHTHSFFDVSVSDSVSLVEMTYRGFAAAIDALIEDIDPLLHWSACPVFLWLDVKFRTYWLLSVWYMLLIWLNGGQVIRSIFSFSIYVTHLWIVGTLIEHGDFCSAGAAASGHRLTCSSSTWPSLTCWCVSHRRLFSSPPACTRGGSLEKRVTWWHRMG